MDEENGGNQEFCFGSVKLKVSIRHLKEHYM